MKRILYSVLLVCFTFSVSGQETLLPTVMDYPNISEKALREYDKLNQKYKALEKRMLAEGAPLSDADKTFMAENEMTIMDGPFNTAAIGCDWYCGGGVAKASASNSLEASKQADNKPMNAHDWDLKTAWATDKNGGIGQHICYYLSPTKTISVTHLEIYNGYQKSETSFKNNNRAKKIALRINGQHLFNLELEDTYKMQKFAIGEHFYGDKEMQIELRILEVYKGEKYNDLCISEINIDGAHDH